MTENVKLPEWQKPCRYCSQKIGFRRDTRSAGGFLIPLDANGERHACAGNSEYQRKLNLAEGREIPSKTQHQEPTSNDLGMYFDDEMRVLRAIEFIQATNQQLTGDFVLTVIRKPREDGKR